MLRVNTALRSRMLPPLPILYLLLSKHDNYDLSQLFWANPHLIFWPNYPSFPRIHSSIFRLSAVLRQQLPSRHSIRSCLALYTCFILGKQKRLY